jgi:hypothetical protein
VPNTRFAIGIIGNLGKSIFVLNYLSPASHAGYCLVARYHLVSGAVAAHADARRLTAGCLHLPVPERPQARATLSILEKMPKNRGSRPS